MANQKLSQEELQQIEEIQKRMQAVKTELGQLGLAELDLKNRRTNVENYLADTQDIETKLVKELEDKYGKGSIDLQNGEFIPLEEKSEKEVVPTVE
jgi:type II secretory pathway component PulJ